MENVASEGRTVLFVSHNMGAIKELCKTALVLKNGKEDFFGSVVSGIQHYSRNLMTAASDETHDHQTEGWARTRINGTVDEDCRVNNNDFVEIMSDLNLPNPLNRVVMHCLIEDAECQQVVHNYIRTTDIGMNSFDAGTYRIEAQIPPLWLKPGVYTLYLKLIGETVDSRQVKYTSERVLVDVADKTGLFAGKVYATILPPVKWAVSASSTTSSVETHGSKSSITAAGLR